MSVSDDVERQISVLQLLGTLTTFLKEILREVPLEQAKECLQRNQSYHVNFTTIQNADLGALLLILKNRFELDFKLYKKTKDIRNAFAHPGLVSSYYSEEKTSECFTTIKDFVSSLPVGPNISAAKDQFHGELTRKTQELENLFRGRDTEKIVQILKDVTSANYEIHVENVVSLHQDLAQLETRLDEADRDREKINLRVDDVLNQVDEANRDRKEIHSKIDAVQENLETLEGKIESITISRKDQIDRYKKWIVKTA